MKKSVDLFAYGNHSIAKAKLQAGPRYSPGIDPNFPSLAIDELTESYDGLARNEMFWERIVASRHKLETSLNSNPIISRTQDLPLKLAPSAKKCRSIAREIFAKLKGSERLQNSTFRNRNIQAITGKVEELQNLASGIYNIILRRKDDPEYLQDKRWRDENHASHLQNESNKLLTQFYDFSSFVNGDAIKYCDDPVSLLLGRAGTGKTHVLCDLAETRREKQKLTFMFIANNLKVCKNDPWKTLLDSLNVPVSKTLFLKEIRNQASIQKERVLIIIDAVNEADRTSWSKLCRILIKDIRQYNEIGLILSCRTPFEHILFSKQLLSNINSIFHPGFNNVEFSAQKEFFRFYKLPEITIPLLHDEFANPLFLKVFCESLHKITVKKSHKHLKELTSGQKGMTYILEHFIKEKQKKIASELTAKGFGKALKYVNWLWGKGSVPGLIKEIASEMSSRGRDFISLTTLDGLLVNYLRDAEALSEIKQYLFSEGVLVEGIEWDNSKANEVVRFGYQKISDHLIIRELLKPYDCTKRSDIRKIYQATKDSPNLFEALMVEFPNRSKKKEFLTQVSAKDITYRDLEAFIEGLYWRENDCVTKDTSTIVDWCLGDNRLKDQMYDALCAVGTRTTSRYNALALDKYLHDKKIIDRDLHWTEYLRKCDRTSSAIKLVNWIIDNDGVVGLSDSESVNTIVLLKWLLTSNRRQLRDKATKALVLVGTSHPKVLFDETTRSLRENDPYVPERMIAASYGTCMRIYNRQSVSRADKLSITTVGKVLYKALFAVNAQFATTHVLIRDYASNIIGIAMLLDPSVIGKRQQKRIAAPYADGGIRRWRRSKDRNDGDYRDGNAPIGMDFGNYTLGRLVRNRSNYDFKHDAYRQVRENVLWRIYDLGYELAKFSEIDKSIARESNWSREDDSSKIDRYGKKYSWIAYFELYGYRQDKGLIDEWDEKSRMSDCDIDPSFPGLPLGEWIFRRDLISDPSQDVYQWIMKAKCPELRTVVRRSVIYGQKGPWILLDGFMKQINDEAAREQSIWIPGRMVKRGGLKKSDARLFSLRDIQELSNKSDSYYAFGGEVTWNSIYPKNGEETLQIEIGERKKTVFDKETVVTKQGHELRLHERHAVLQEISNLLRKDNDRLDEYLISNEIDFVERKISRVVQEPVFKDVQYYTPVSSFSWESYHSSANPGQNVIMPSREIIDFAELKINLPLWDFCDKKGEKAIIVIDAGEGYGTRQRLTYIREDILMAYLKQNGLELVWFVSGERQVRYRDAFSSAPNSDDNHKPYKTYSRIIKYSANSN